MIGQKIIDRLKNDKIVLASAATVLIFLLLAVGSWLGLAGQGWSQTSPDLRVGINGAHWMGTNAIGQDIFDRGIASTGTAFEVGLVVAIAATILGGLLGAISGYNRGRWFDHVMMWLLGVVESIPFYLLVAALVFALKGHPLAMHIAMVLGFWTTTARLTRSEAARLSQLPFVEAARTLDIPRLRIIWRHIIPNCTHLLLVQFTITFVGAVKAEVILSFLGLGIQDGVSWGLMIAESTRDILAGHFGNFFMASVSLFLLVMALNLLADAMQDVLDPRFEPLPVTPGARPAG